MKRFNKQILEAVHRGIQLALDDYQDIEPNSSISSTNDVIDDNDDIKKRVWLHENFVDLGLPSGTLWAKYNLGVNPKNLKPEEWWCDLGLQTAEDWYGNYYAWGETQIKEKYSWETYKFGKSEKSLTKYCNDDSYGKKTIDETSPWGFWRYKDDLIKLLPEDDVVTQTYGEHFHMPNEDECNELLSYCTYKWKKDYHDIKGLCGYVLMSNINYNTIFIPAAGIHGTYGLQYTSSLAWFWCSSLYYGDSARVVAANDHSINLSMHNKYVGVPVRAVFKK